MMKKFRREYAILLGLLGFLLSIALTVEYRRVVNYMFGDEAVYYMMAQSFAYDLDLEYTQKDLWRVYEDSWDAGPQGVFLTKMENGRIYYSKSFAYSLLLAPFIALFGFNGFLVLNMLLLFLMILMGWFYLRQFNSPFLSLLVAMTFFLLSASFVYTFWLTPEIFNMFCIALGLFLWLYQRERRGFDETPRHKTSHSKSPTLATIFLTPFRLLKWLISTPEGRFYLAPIPIAVAGASKLPNVLFIFPIVADVLIEGYIRIFRKKTRSSATPPRSPLYWRSSILWRSAAKLLVICTLFVIVILLFYALQYVFTGHINQYAGDRKTFYWDFPLSSFSDVWEKGIRLSNDDYFEESFYINPKVILYNIYYYIFGRFTGLLPYFFCALLAVYYFVRRSITLQRSFSVAPLSRKATIRTGEFSRRLLLLLTIGASIFVYIFMAPSNYQGGGGAFGNRFFVNIYPAFFFLITTISGLGSLVVSWLVGSIFLAQTLMNPFQTSIYPAPHAFRFPYRFLPVELTLLNTLPTNVNTHLMQQPRTKSPAYRLYFVDENSVEQTAYDFWVRGEKTAELAIRLFQPRSYLTVTVINGPVGNQVDLTVAGKSASVILGQARAKRQLVFPLNNPVPYFDSSAYSLKIRSHTGFVPKFIAGTGLNDQRYLGCRIQISVEPYDAGVAFLESGRLDEAISIFQEVLRENPRHIRAHHSLGVAYQRSGQFKNALKEFQRAKMQLVGFQKWFRRRCQSLNDTCPSMAAPTPIAEPLQAQLTDFLAPLIIRFEAEDLAHSTGHVVDQSEASNGKVVEFQADQHSAGFLAYGQDITLPEGEYQVRVRIKTGNANDDQSPHPKTAFSYDVYSKRHGILMKGSIAVQPAQYFDIAGYRDYTLNFNIERPDTLEFRIETTGSAHVAVDRIDVYHRLPLDVFHGFANSKKSLKAYEEAYHQLQQVVQLDSWSPAVQFDYLQTLFSLERWEEALQFIIENVNFSDFHTGILTLLFHNEPNPSQLAGPLQTLREELLLSFSPEVSLNSNFEKKIEFSGYTLSTHTMTVGETFTIQYIWKAIDNIDEDYTVLVHFIKKGGVLVSDRFSKIKRKFGIPIVNMFHQEHQPLHGTHPTSKWITEELIREQYDVPVPRDLETGTYEIWLGLRNPLTNHRLQTDTEAIKIKLGEIQIRDE